MKNVRLRLAAPVMAAVFLAGCGSTKIGRILDDPTRYRNRSVQVQGTVDRSFGALVAGVYQVQDDTGKIYVVSSSGVPRKGARVKVKGKVMSGVTFGSRSVGTALREESHKSSY